MRKATLFLISVLVSGILFAEDFNFQEIDFFAEQFYSGNEIDIGECKNILLQSKSEFETTKSTDTLFALIYCATRFSDFMTYYLSDENKEIILKTEKMFSPMARKSKDEKILNQYAKYLYSKIAWTKNNFGIIETLPALYERNLFYNNSKESKLLLAEWQTNSVTGFESNWISFIENSECLIDELPLSKIDLFNTYISYSIFYMKILDTKTGFEYLNRAEKLFPNSFSVAILGENFRQGRYGW